MSDFGIWYTTRERVINGIDAGMPFESKLRVDEAIESASRTIESQTHRTFYPEYRSVSIDWPARSSSPGWRVWLNQNELISLESATSGGSTLTVADLLLYPAEGPPFNRIEVDLSSSSSLSAGATRQQSLVLTGWFGYTDNTRRCGSLDASAASGDSTIDCIDSSRVGIGTVLIVDSERMVVTDKAWITSAQTSLAAMAAANNVVSISVTTGSAFFAGEVLLIDSEKMVVDFVSGNTLTVRRAQFGTVLASHSLGATIYVPRRLTVTRGVLGTTAAAHSDDAALSRWVPPRGIESWCVAEATALFLAENSGYARTIGSGESEHEVRGNSLSDLRHRAWIQYGRKSRMRSV